MPAVRLSSKNLASFLKVDCFGEPLRIRFAGDRADQDIVSRPVFFNQLYVGVRNGKMSVRYGMQDEYREYKYDNWIRDLKKALKSAVVFIEGYAGCGKSVFVQKVLTEIFPGMDYDRNYYNYDIGFTFEHKNQNRIKDAILECFIDQYVLFTQNGHSNIIAQMEHLLTQEVVGYLDNSRNIFYEFTATKAYLDAKRLLVDEKDISSFRKIIHDQLTELSSEQIIYIDCIMRLAKYIICNDEPETQIICYDNLDAIENNAELCNFDNILLTIRENMDSYLSKSSVNYNHREIPHFIFIATFRKITAVKVGLFDGSERFADNRRQMENVCFVDGSHLFNYKQMVVNRYKYLKKYSKDNSIESDVKNTLKQMREITQLFDTNFVNSRFAGLWNNNFRICSDIMECIMEKYENEVISCIELTKQNSDSYDERINVASGASAIFLSIICKVQRDCDYWGKLHLSVNELNSSIPTVEEIEQSKELVVNLTTLSRLILTYVSNAKYVEHRYVSTGELYSVFLGVYSVDDIAKVLANMLTHDNQGIWRRPIVYTKNVIYDGKNVFEELKSQGQMYSLIKNPEAIQFTEITTCECGESFISRVSCDFEYYSVRLGHSKSLYIIQKISEIEAVLEDVYNAVCNCCQKMIVFKKYYCKKKDMKGKYYNQLFHPRTYNRKSQLHTERVIFNHIEYLDNYRYYVEHCTQSDISSQKQEIREAILAKIDEYLKLYSQYILGIDIRRSSIANELSQKLSVVKSNPEDDSTRIQAR